MAINPLAINPFLPKKYLHFAFQFAGRPLAVELESVFDNLSGDWLRYTPNCWVAWTQKDADTWFATIKPYLGPNDGVVILELQQPMQAVGWRPSWIWDWFNKPRQ